MRRAEISVGELAEGVWAGDRTLLARSITLVESEHPDHQKKAGELLAQLFQKKQQGEETKPTYRIGISGVPGVGKSTFIDAFGTFLTKLGYKVAILAVDPSSSVSRGSILGDKTRMSRLSHDPNAFIRPSPSSGTLGGVTQKTRESMTLLESAGFDVIIVETVGVGQSETVVADMVDFYLVLMLAGAGDDLQGIKRGILEVADMLAINKADGDNKPKADRARKDYEMALHIMRSKHASWHPPVLTCSALQDEGLGPIWENIEKHRERMCAQGDFEKKRAEQRVRWMWSAIDHGLEQAFERHEGIRSELTKKEESVREGQVPPTRAAIELLDEFLKK